VVTMQESEETGRMIRKAGESRVVQYRARVSFSLSDVLFSFLVHCTAVVGSASGRQPLRRKKGATTTAALSSSLSICSPPLPPPPLLLPLFPPSLFLFALPIALCSLLCAAAVLCRRMQRQLQSIAACTPGPCMPYKQ